MSDDKKIIVPELRKKLDYLYEHAIGKDFPLNQNQLGEQLYQRREKLDFSIRGVQIKKACDAEDHIEKANGNRLSYKVHRTILDLFGVTSIPVEYYDPERLGRDRSAEKFARTLIPRSEQIILERIPRNRNFTREALFVLDVEDQSSKRPFVGMIMIKPETDLIKPDENDEHPDRIVGECGFDDIMVHIDVVDVGGLASQEIIKGDLNGHIEIVDRHSGMDFLWHVKSLPNTDGTVSLLKGKLNVGKFIVSEIEHETGQIDVFATAQIPKLRLAEWRRRSLSGKPYGEYFNRYEKIAVAAVKEACGISSDDDRRLTLGIVSFHPSQTLALQSQT